MGNFTPALFGGPFSITACSSVLCSSNSCVNQSNLLPLFLMALIYSARAGQFGIIPTPVTRCFLRFSGDDIMALITIIMIDLMPVHELGLPASANIRIIISHRSFDAQSHEVWL